MKKIINQGIKEMGVFMFFAWCFKILALLTMGFYGIYIFLQ
mgnify:CR=1 FL=1